MVFVPTEVEMTTESVAEGSPRVLEKVIEEKPVMETLAGKEKSSLNEGEPQVPVNSLILDPVTQAPQVSLFFPSME